MRAIVRKGFGGLEQLVIQERPNPEPQLGQVIIEVKAFGINHAETHMRKGEWAEAAEISGIECVGLVKSCPDGQFTVGTKVAALMGGMGRSINGSYAEYTRVPATNVVRIESELSWEDLAVIPESYATAWTCLHRNLELAEGQTLVIRRATSALAACRRERSKGLASCSASAHVIHGTRRRNTITGRTPSVMMRPVGWKHAVALRLGPEDGMEALEIESQTDETPFASRRQFPAQGELAEA
jgi:NADPH:quinone reductase